MRWILITGCSSGIGRHAAIALQQRGYAVIASARQQVDVEQLREQGLQHVIQLDLSDSDSVQAAVAAAIEISGGRLSALFNNGAYGQPGAVEDLSRDALRRQFETNLFGTIELTNLLIPLFLQQPEARIVQNSSVLGFVAMRFRGAYNASKFALEGITDTLRLELAGTAVKIILIEPGPIDTRFRANSHAAFEREIDLQNSRFGKSYEAMIKRLESDNPTARFTLGPEAVTQALVHALESKRPRLRYRVTTPTRVLALLRRILPAGWLDLLVKRY